MKHYMVTGRIIGWDEDVSLTYQVASKEEAVTIFVEDLWEIEQSSYIDPDDITYTEDRKLSEANGEGAVVNSVFVSDTEIKEAV